jgi:propionyl-CoA carboxylase beta chain
VKIVSYQVEKQHRKAKYHAIERIQMLLDRDSFSEMGSGMSDYSNCSGGSGKSIPYDGVITGRGTIRGKTVFVYSQDFSVKGGTVGRRHGEKIAQTIGRAIFAQSPIIGIYDSGGARIEEGINALAGCGDMMYYNTLASGYIPQFSVVVGPCAGAAAYSPAITDFVFMVDNIGCMFVTGSDVVKSVTGETYTNQELGGAEIHSTISGVAHRRFSNEKDCFRLLRDLIEILPSSCVAQNDGSAQFIEKTSPDIAEILPNVSQKPYDMRKIIAGFVDDNSFIEMADGFAKSIVVGFAKLSGKTIGIIANQPLDANGVLTYDSSDKAARFVRFCDCFNVPIITFVDTPGYLPGKEQEHGGIIRHGAKLLFAYSEATVPKITIIVRKAYGGAYIAMGSKHMRADYVYAFENAEVAVMGASGAASILYKKELSQIEDDKIRQDFLNQKTDDYQRDFLNVRIAQSEGFVDEVISFQDLRRRIFDDLNALKHKVDLFSINKKHGNIPL